ncbi:hypothetical protein ACWD5V_02575 [Streptomyces sp. NPDC002523]
MAAANLLGFYLSGSLVYTHATAAAQAPSVSVPDRPLTDAEEQPLTLAAGATTSYPHRIGPHLDRAGIRPPVP